MVFRADPRVIGTSDSLCRSQEGGAMRQSRTAAFAVVVAVLSTFPAWGIQQRSFVSGSGSDSNPCTIDLKCRSFAAALTQTSANGEVVAYDSAGYGPVTITKAV